MSDAARPVLPSQRTASLQPSLIRAVADPAIGREGVIPLWFGEGAWPTPDIIVAAATRSLNGGEHSYQPNSGRLDLREAIAHYHADWPGVPVDIARITVTASGMQGIMLCAQLLTDPGDEVIVIEPSWPNIAEAFSLNGAKVISHALTVDPTSRWSLDVDALITAITPRTRAVAVNSPGNPTGWVMPSAAQQKLLAHCRTTGSWLILDDVYSRLYRNGPQAPSFLSLAEPDDRVISINSFSKAWSMTGWRLGWLVAPASLETPLAMLNEFNIAGPPAFVQRAGIAALEHGEPYVAELRQRLDAAYASLASHLAAMPSVEFTIPQGAFYAMLRIEGQHDSLVSAQRLLADTGVGLAPGRAFGESAEGWLRLCYAQPVDVLEQALQRLGDWVDTGCGLR